MDQSAARAGYSSLSILLRDLRTLWSSFAADRLELAALAAITLIGLLLRLAFLHQAMRCDESWTYLDLASQPISHAISHYPAPGNHVFHTLLVAFSTRLFGSEPWAIRLPALVAGVLMIPAAYVAWRAHFCRRVGLLAAGLVAGGAPYLVAYSVNARGYTLVALVFLILAALAAYIARKPEVRAAWITFSIVAALGLFVIPTMLYGIAGIMVWLAVVGVLERPHGVSGRRFFTNLLVTGIFTALLATILYAPALLVSGPAAVLSNRYVVPRGLSEVVAQLPGTVVQAWRYASVPLAGPIAFCALVLAALGAARYRKVSSWPFPLFVAMFAAILTVLLLQRVVPFVRVWTFLMPLYFALVAAGIVALFRRVLGRQVIAAVVSLSLCIILAWTNYRTRAPSQFAEDGIFPGAQDVATYLLAQNLSDRDRVIATLADTFIIEYYATRQGHRGQIRFVSNEDLPTPTPLDLRDAERVLLVINDQMSNPRSTAETARLPLEQLRGFTPIQGFFDSSVYERRRRD